MPEPLKLVPRQPEDSVVELLERMLVRAKAGELRTIAIYAEEVGDGYDIWTAGKRNYPQMVGALELLKEGLIRISGGQ